jgi:hypothetical protein
MKHYYIFGLQRSGTNYIEQLIKENFIGLDMANVRGHAWKHSIDVPDDMTKNIVPIIVYKNKYTWIESIVFRTPIDFFKKQTMYLPSSDNIEAIAKTYKHWCQTWLNEYSDECIIIKYEDLLNDTKRECFLETIRTIYQVERKHAHWVNIEPGKVSISRKYTKDMQEYYLKEKPALLTQEQIDTINTII